ncbi:MAG: HAMP domain-containing histidine kinase [Bacteroidaceae bacterium]|nr:HAMP domain-containing histidine kinase [Bacteroidaceae bacterium]
MEDNSFWYLLIFVSAAIMLVAIELAVVGMIINIRYNRAIRKEGDIYEIASPKVLCGLLNLTGAYFFMLENNRIRISGVRFDEAERIEERLENRDDINEFISSSIDSLRSTGTTETFSMQVRIALTGDEKHWYEIRLTMSRYKKNKIRSRGIFIPIDNIKQRERDAIEMHRRTLNAEERDDFIREMNHSVRTPLNAIVGFSEILADPDMEITPEEMVDYKSTIESNAKSLTKILENVLTISHLGSENILVVDKPVSVPDFMRSLVEANKAALDEAGIVAEEELSPMECRINADEKILRKVFQILIDNVIQHASSGKLLAYGWIACEDGSIELYIKDRGPGIDDSDLPFIYKAFYKADPFSTGTGQGLTIAKGYLEHEKAEIRCKTSKRGSTFFVKFRNVAPLIIPLPFIGYCVFLLSLLCLILSVKFYRKVKLTKSLNMIDNEAITRTLEVSGGHLFKFRDDCLHITKKTAEWFSFSSNHIGLDVYMDSMDEADKEVMRKLKDVNPGNIVSDFISLPNFRTFKIMSFSCMATKVKDDDGVFVPMGMFFSIDEAHARMEAMRAVYAKEEESIAKQSFIASMGHEIRNPLNAIVGFSSLLADLYFEIDEKERANYAEVISKSNEHLLSLLDGALLSAKEQDKLLRSSLNVLPIQDVMEELYKTNSVIVPSRLSFDFEKGGDAKAKISRTGMRQIISNLINNACKFTEKGGITFGWNVTDDRVNIYVRDTGMGMTPENIENIFKKFFKADSTSSGAGIGLPLCKRLTEMMDGQLLVESTYGQGSCFTVSLPRISDEEAMAEANKVTETK